MNIKEKGAINVIAAEFTEMGLIPATKERNYNLQNCYGKIYFFFTKRDQVDRACKNELQRSQSEPIQI